MFYIATTLIATYAIILNIALPSDFCGNALMAFLPPYYLVRWALYTLLTAKGDAMNVANSHAALFRGVWICAAFVTPVLLSIYTVIIAVTTTITIVSFVSKGLHNSFTRCENNDSLIDSRLYREPSSQPGIWRWRMSMGRSSASPILTILARPK